MKRLLILGKFKSKFNNTGTEVNNGRNMSNTQNGFKCNFGKFINIFREIPKIKILGYLPEAAAWRQRSRISP